MNDAPVNTVPGAQSVEEDTTLRSPASRSPTWTAPCSPPRSRVTNGTLNVALRRRRDYHRQRHQLRRHQRHGDADQHRAREPHYHGNPNFNGADTLTVTTSDGALSDTDTVAITVNSVNDAPVNTVPGAQTVNEDTTLPIAGVSVADVDSTALTTTLTVTNGALNVTTGGGAVIAGNGTDDRHRQRHGGADQRRAGGSELPRQLDFNGSDTLTVATSDGSSSDIDVVGITVGSVNDPPVNTVPGPQTVNEDTALSIAGISVADVDGTCSPPRSASRTARST